MKKKLFSRSRELIVRFFIGAALTAGEPYELQEVLQEMNVRIHYLKFSTSVHTTI